jgi:hypothetical protein
MRFIVPIFEVLLAVFIASGVAATIYSALTTKQRYQRAAARRPSRLTT